ncbi:hypothetical protein Javan290_0056 [Streptococcus phage Javan290]|uniref:hypothetical protein n=1 Tax=Streptococcus marmotae TaxID=1825069 RepID=UPI00083066E3|nr:hypothetical protein [Streptococcus marmotae]QBX26110.1 hypothetical protein Javan290_0056 [Streptococcus phage Javan290]
MKNIAEKVIRLEGDAYEFVVDFAIKYDLKISEAASVMLRYCATKDLKVIRKQTEVVENVITATDS